MSYITNFKRVILSFISLLSTVIALITSFFATVTVSDTSYYSTIKSTTTYHSVIWGATHSIKTSTSSTDITTTYLKGLIPPVQLLCTFIIIALVIGILCVAFSQKDNTKLLYIVFGIVLLVSAIAFFGSTSIAESYLKTSNTTIVVAEGPITCGVFLVISSILTFCCAIPNDEY